MSKTIRRTTKNKRKQLKLNRVHKVQRTLRMLEDLELTDKKLINKIIRKNVE